LPKIVEERSHKWIRYYEGLKAVDGLEFMDITPGSSLIPFRFPILSDDRDGLVQSLEANAIQTRSFFYPMHLQPKLMTSPPRSRCRSVSSCS